MAAPKDSPGGGRSFDTLMEDYGERLSLRTPADMIVLFIFCMPVYGAFRVCIEAGIFRALAQASPRSLTLGEIAGSIEGATDDDPAVVAEREEYICRMLRGVCALNFIDEVAPAEYSANELTRTMAEPGFEKGFKLCFDNMFGPKSSAFEMLEWSTTNGYRAPVTSRDGPYQRARGIVGTTAFEDWNKDENIMNLSAFMQRIQVDRLNWSEWFPTDVLFRESEPGGIFMVDVGGGFGHDLAGLAARYKYAPFKLVLQDQPNVIREARKGELDPRIEFMDHDFFLPQPVRSADIYFMHKIMHDWPDAECVKILSHLRDAMAPHSRIFINDMILPEQASPLIFPAFDLMMFTMLSAKERSESMWARLVEQVDGLTIKKAWQAPELRGEGIVELGWVEK